MLRPKVMNVDALAIPGPVSAWVPGPDEPVWYELTLHIGDGVRPSADLYSVVVCNAAGARSTSHRYAVPPIVVEPYGWVAVEREIERRMGECVGVSWLGVQEALRVRFDWEYEGM